MNIPFLSFKSMNQETKVEIIDAFEKFFDNSWYVLGKSVTEFEQLYAEFNNVNYCVGVSNGLDALHISLKTLDIKPGDEIIIPSNTYIATLLSATYLGAKPVLVEPRLTTYNINPEEIESSITEKTRAIMPVHLYGQACEMESIMAIARKHNLYVVEDNAQAQGSSFNGKLAGSWGDINATSFYPGKNLGALGDAGGITTDNEQLANKARVLRNYGSQKKYFNETVGFNMRLDECQAAFLSIKLKYLNKWTEERQSIASWYNNELQNIGDIILPSVSHGSSHVYHLYVIRSKFRNELQSYLNSNGIGTLIHYPIPPHQQEAYKDLGYQSGSLPIAEEIANTCLSLPLYPGLSRTEVSEIAEIIRKFFDRV